MSEDLKIVDLRVKSESGELGENEGLPLLAAGAIMAIAEMRGIEIRPEELVCVMNLDVLDRPEFFIGFSSNGEINDKTIFSDRFVSYDEGKSVRSYGGDGNPDHAAGLMNGFIDEIKTSKR